MSRSSARQFIETAGLNPAPRLRLRCRFFLRRFVPGDCATQNPKTPKPADEGGLDIRPGPGNWIDLTVASFPPSGPFCKPVLATGLFVLVHALAGLGASRGVLNACLHHPTPSPGVADRY